jgi:hypothetical protein
VRFYLHLDVGDGKYIDTVGALAATLASMADELVQAAPPMLELEAWNKVGARDLMVQMGDQDLNYFGRFGFDHEEFDKRNLQEGVDTIERLVEIDIPSNSTDDPSACMP